MGIHIGTSGWSYDHWQGILYPADIPGIQRLDYYLQRFSTVELNASYYHWPRDMTFSGWKKRLPPGFLMTVKAPRPLTHSKKLHQPEQWLQRIADSVSLLGEHMGVLLVQLPPRMAYDPPRLLYFLQQLPSWLRVCIEFRHPSWHTEEVFELLRQYGVAYCVMSGARLPCMLQATAPFVYVRLHGPDHEHMYGGFYSDADLDWWATRMREWSASGHDVFAYFNNDGGGHAVYNALRLKEILGV